MNPTGAVALLPAQARRPLVGPQRENTLGRVKHPDPLRLGGRTLERIDDPLVRPLQDGYPPLGWEGDERMCLYADRQHSQFLLVRLEWDGQYRIEKTTTITAGTISPVDLVAQLIADIVESDHHRGHNPYSAVAAANEAVEAEADREIADWAGEQARQLRRAFGYGRTF